MTTWLFAQDALVDAHKGETAFVVGNGPRRKSVDLGVLQKSGVLIGCNAITEDVAPHYAVAVDGLAGRLLWDTDLCPVLTQRTYQNPRDFPAYRWRSQSWDSFIQGGKQIDVSSYFIRGISGVVALQLALLAGCDPIVLVGMEHTVEVDQSPSIYCERGHPAYGKHRSFPSDGVVRTEGGLIPKQWIGSVRKLWWIIHSYSTRRAIYRYSREGALTFLPVYGEDPRDPNIPPPPGGSISEFHRAIQVAP